MVYIGDTPRTTSFASVVKDAFSGDGSTDAFTLSKVATTNSVSVFVENVRQEPTTAYSVSGTTLTFTAAPVTSSGNNIYVLHMNPTATATHPAAQNLTAVDGTFTGNIELGHASDTTIARASSGVVSVEGKNVALATPNTMAGTLLLTTTVSDDATVDFNSTYVTSTYDHYDLLITGLIPATDNTWLGLRFGTANSADSGSDKYAYIVYYIGVSASDNNQINANYDNHSNTILVTPTTNFSMGTGTGEGLSIHIRCWDLSSTSLYKKATPMAAGTMGAGAYFGQSYASAGGYFEASAVNYISLHASSGNLASGTVSLYGIKKG